MQMDAKVTPKREHTPKEARPSRREALVQKRSGQLPQKRSGQLPQNRPRMRRSSPWDNLHIEDVTLGYGQTGVVHAGTHRGQPVAIKLCRERSLQVRRPVVRAPFEALALRAVGDGNHPHVVRLIADGRYGSLTQGAWCFVMERLHGPSLLHATLRDVQHLAQALGQITSALRYSAHKGFAVADLWPANILFRDLACNHAVLIDFSHAIPLLKSGDLSHSVATEADGSPYCPPEVGDIGDFGEFQIEHGYVFQLGMMLQDGIHALQNQTQTQKPKQIQALTGFVSAMTAEDPNLRPTLSDVEAWLYALCSGERQAPQTLKTLKATA